MNWLKQLFAGPPKPVSLCVPMFARGMDLEAFQSIEDRVGEVRRLYKTELMQDIFGVLRQKAPRGYPLRGESVSQEQALIELGRKEGYCDCVDLLVALANYAPAGQKEIEPDWGAGRLMAQEGLGGKYKG